LFGAIDEEPIIMKTYAVGRIRKSLILASLVASAWLALGDRLPGDEETPPNTLSAAEKSEGWKLLFDGKTTEGWRKYRGTKVGDAWQIVDGALVLDTSKGKKGGDIITVEEYGNFELIFDWKIAKGGNSGVMYRVTEGNDAPYMSGPEYQLLDNRGHADGKSPLTSAGSAYGVYAPLKDKTRPVGDWNHSKIFVKGLHVEHWLNGEKLLSYDVGSDDWTKRVKASKWKDVPTYGRAMKGHIDLQDHGDVISFRNIKIRPMPPGK
jgi:hypothetical protein